MRALALAVVALAASPARADPAAAGAAPPPSAVAAARDRFAVGQTLYERGRYREAANEFEAAYRAAPLPAFLANIGQAYRRLGHRAVARDYYQRYLADAPADTEQHRAERGVVAGYLAEVERAIAAEGPGPPLPVEAPPPVRERVVTKIVERPVETVGPPWYRARAGWGVLSVGLACAIAGGVLLSRVGPAEAEARVAATSQEWLDARGRATSFDGSGIAALAVGGVLVVAAVVLFVLHTRPTRAPLVQP